MVVMGLHDNNGGQRGCYGVYMTKGDLGGCYGVYLTLTARLEGCLLHSVRP